MNAYIIKPDTIFKLSDDKDIINIEVLNGLITKHKSLITDRYKKLYDAYIGDYPILHQADKETYKPDNRVVVNFAKYIVDTFNGFLLVFQSKYLLRKKKLMIISTC